MLPGRSGSTRAGADLSCPQGCRGQVSTETVTAARPNGGAAELARLAGDPAAQLPAGTGPASVSIARGGTSCSGTAPCSALIGSSGTTAVITGAGAGTTSAAAEGDCESGRTGAGACSVTTTSSTASGDNPAAVVESLRTRTAAVTEGTTRAVAAAECAAAGYCSSTAGGFAAAGEAQVMAGCDGSGTCTVLARNTSAADGAVHQATADGSCTAAADGRCITRVVTETSRQHAMAAAACQGTEGSTCRYAYRAQSTDTAPGAAAAATGWGEGTTGDGQALTTAIAEGGPGWAQAAASCNGSPGTNCEHEYSASVSAAAGGRSGTRANASASGSAKGGMGAGAVAVTAHAFAQGSQASAGATCTGAANCKASFYAHAEASDQRITEATYLVEKKRWDAFGWGTCQGSSSSGGSCGVQAYAVAGPGGGGGARCDGYCVGFVSGGYNRDTIIGPKLAPPPGFAVDAQGNLVRIALDPDQRKAGAKLEDDGMTVTLWVVGADKQLVEKKCPIVCTGATLTAPSGETVTFERRNDVPFTGAIPTEVGGPDWDRATGTQGLEAARDINGRGQIKITGTGTAYDGKSGSYTVYDTPSRPGTSHVADLADRTGAPFATSCIDGCYGFATNGIKGDQFVVKQRDANLKVVARDLAGNPARITWDNGLGTVNGHEGWTVVANGDGKPFIGPSLKPVNPSVTVITPGNGNPLGFFEVANQTGSISLPDGRRMINRAGDEPRSLGGEVVRARLNDDKGNLGFIECTGLCSRPRDGKVPAGLTFAPKDDDTVCPVLCTLQEYSADPGNRVAPNGYFLANLKAEAGLSGGMAKPVTIVTPDGDTASCAGKDCWFVVFNRDANGNNGTIVCSTGGGPNGTCNGANREGDWGADRSYMVDPAGNPIVGDGKGTFVAGGVRLLLRNAGDGDKHAGVSCAGPYCPTSKNNANGWTDANWKAGSLDGVDRYDWKGNPDATWLPAVDANRPQNVFGPGSYLRPSLNTAKDRETAVSLGLDPDAPNLMLPALTPAERAALSPADRARYDKTAPYSILDLAAASAAHLESQSGNRYRSFAFQQVGGGAEALDALERDIDAARQGGVTAQELSALTKKLAPMKIDAQRWADDRGLIDAIDRLTYRPPTPTELEEKLVRNPAVLDKLAGPTPTDKASRIENQPPMQRAMDNLLDLQRGVGDRNRTLVSALYLQAQVRDTIHQRELHNADVLRFNEVGGSKEEEEALTQNGLRLTAQMDRLEGLLGSASGAFADNDAKLRSVDMLFADASNDQGWAGRLRTGSERVDRWTALVNALAASGDPNQVALADEARVVGQLATLNYNSIAQDFGQRAAGVDFTMRSPSSRLPDVSFAQTAALNFPGFEHYVGRNADRVAHLSRAEKVALASRMTVSEYMDAVSRPQVSSDWAVNRKLIEANYTDASGNVDKDKVDEEMENLRAAAAGGGEVRFVTTGLLKDGQPAGAVTLFFVMKDGTPTFVLGGKFDSFAELQDENEMFEDSSMFSSPKMEFVLPDDLVGLTPIRVNADGTAAPIPAGEQLRFGTSDATITTPFERTVNVGGTVVMTVLSVVSLYVTWGMSTPAVAAAWTARGAMAGVQVARAATMFNAVRTTAGAMALTNTATTTVAAGMGASAAWELGERLYYSQSINPFTSAAARGHWLDAATMGAAGAARGLGRLAKTATTAGANGRLEVSARVFAGAAEVFDYGSWVNSGYDVARNPSVEGFTWFLLEGGQIKGERVVHHRMKAAPFGTTFNPATSLGDRNWLPKELPGSDDLTMTERVHWLLDDAQLRPNEQVPVEAVASRLGVSPDEVNAALDEDGNGWYRNRTVTNDAGVTQYIARNPGSKINITDRGNVHHITKLQNFSFAPEDAPEIEKLIGLVGDESNQLTMDHPLVVDYLNELVDPIDPALLDHLAKNPYEVADPANADEQQKPVQQVLPVQFVQLAQQLKTPLTDPTNPDQPVDPARVAYIAKLLGAVRKDAAPKDAGPKNDADPEVDIVRGGLGSPDAVPAPNKVHLPENAELPGGIVLPGGAVLPKGTVLPGGALLPGGQQLPAGTVLTEAIRVQAGTVLPKGAELPGGAMLLDGADFVSALQPAEISKLEELLNVRFVDKDSGDSKDSGDGEVQEADDPQRSEDWRVTDEELPSLAELFSYAAGPNGAILAMRGDLRDAYGQHLVADPNAYVVVIQNDDDGLFIQTPGGKIRLTAKQAGKLIRMLPGYDDWRVRAAKIAAETGSHPDVVILGCGLGSCPVAMGELFQELQAPAVASDATVWLHAPNEDTGGRSRITTDGSWFRVDRTGLNTTQAPGALTDPLGTPDAVRIGRPGVTIPIASNAPPVHLGRTVPPGGEAGATRLHGPPFREYRFTLSWTNQLVVEGARRTAIAPSKFASHLRDRMRNGDWFPSMITLDHPALRDKRDEVIRSLRELLGERFEVVARGAGSIEIAPLMGTQHIRPVLQTHLLNQFGDRVVNPGPADTFPLVFSLVHPDGTTLTRLRVYVRRVVKSSSPNYKAMQLLVYDPHQPRGAEVGDFDTSGGRRWVVLGFDFETGLWVVQATGIKRPFRKMHPVPVRNADLERAQQVGIADGEHYVVATSEHLYEAMRRALAIPQTEGDTDSSQSWLAEQATVLGSEMDAAVGQQEAWKARRQVVVDFIFENRINDRARWIDLLKRMPGPGIGSFRMIMENLFQIELTEAEAAEIEEARGERGFGVLPRPGAPRPGAVAGGAVLPASFSPAELNAVLNDWARLDRRSPGLFENDRKGFQKALSFVLGNLPASDRFVVIDALKETLPAADWNPMRKTLRAIYAGRGWKGRNTIAFIGFLVGGALVLPAAFGGNRAVADPGTPGGGTGGDFWSAVLDVVSDPALWIGLGVTASAVVVIVRFVKNWKARGPPKAAVKLGKAFRWVGQLRKRLTFDVEHRMYLPGVMYGLTVLAITPLLVKTIGAELTATVLPFLLLFPHWKLPARDKAAVWWKFWQWPGRLVKWFVGVRWERAVMIAAVFTLWTVPLATWDLVGPFSLQIVGAGYLIAGYLTMSMSHKLHREDETERVKVPLAFAPDHQLSFLFVINTPLIASLYSMGGAWSWVAAGLVALPQIAFGPFLKHYIVSGILFLPMPDVRAPKVVGWRLSARLTYWISSYDWGLRSKRWENYVFWQIGGEIRLNGVPIWQRRFSFHAVAYDGKARKSLDLLTGPQRVLVKLLFWMARGLTKIPGRIGRWAARSPVKRMELAFLHLVNHAQRMLVRHLAEDAHDSKRPGDKSERRKKKRKAVRAYNAKARADIRKRLAMLPGEFQKRMQDRATAEIDRITKKLDAVKAELARERTKAFRNGGGGRSTWFGRIRDGRIRTLDARRKDLQNRLDAAVRARAAIGPPQVEPGRYLSKELAEAESKRKALAAELTEIDKERGQQGLPGDRRKELNTRRKAVESALSDSKRWLDRLKRIVPMFVGIAGTAVLLIGGGFGQGKAMAAPGQGIGDGGSAGLLPELGDVLQIVIDHGVVGLVVAAAVAVVVVATGRGPPVSVRLGRWVAATRYAARYAGGWAGALLTDVTAPVRTWWAGARFGMRLGTGRVGLLPVQEAPPAELVSDYTVMDLQARTPVHPTTHQHGLVGEVLDDLGVRSAPAVDGKSAFGLHGMRAVPGFSVVPVDGLHLAIDGKRIARGDAGFAVLFVPDPDPDEPSRIYTDTKTLKTVQRMSPADRLALAEHLTGAGADVSLGALRRLAGLDGFRWVQGVFGGLLSSASSVGSALVLPDVAPNMQEKFRVSPGEANAPFTVNQGTSAPATLASGFLAGRYSQRSLLVGALLGTAAVLVALANAGWFGAVLALAGVLGFTNVVDALTKGLVETELVFPTKKDREKFQQVMRSASTMGRWLFRFLALQLLLAFVTDYKPAFYSLAAEMVLLAVGALVLMPKDSGAAGPRGKGWRPDERSDGSVMDLRKRARTLLARLAAAPRAAANLVGRLRTLFHREPGAERRGFGARTLAFLRHGAIVPIALGAVDGFVLGSVLGTEALVIKSLGLADSMRSLLSFAALGAGVLTLAGALTGVFTKLAGLRTAALLLGGALVVPLLANVLPFVAPVSVFWTLFLSRVAIQVASGLQEGVARSSLLDAVPFRLYKQFGAAFVAARVPAIGLGSLVASIAIGAATAAGVHGVIGVLAVAGTAVAVELVLAAAIVARKPRRFDHGSGAHGIFDTHELNVLFSATTKIVSAVASGRIKGRTLRNGAPPAGDVSRTEPAPPGLLRRSESLVLVDGSVVLSVLEWLVGAERAADIAARFDAVTFRGATGDAVILMTEARYEHLARLGELPRVVDHERGHIEGRFADDAAHDADVTKNRAAIAGTEAAMNRITEVSGPLFDDAPRTPDIAKRRAKLAKLAGRGPAADELIALLDRWLDKADADLVYKQRGIAAEAQVGDVDRWIGWFVEILGGGRVTTEMLDVDTDARVLANKGRELLPLLDGLPNETFVLGTNVSRWSERRAERSGQVLDLLEKIERTRKSWPGGPTAHRAASSAMKRWWKGFRQQGGPHGILDDKQTELVVTAAEQVAAGVLDGSLPGQVLRNTGAAAVAELLDGEVLVLVDEAVMIDVLDGGGAPDGAGTVSRTDAVSFRRPTGPGPRDVIVMTAERFAHLRRLDALPVVFTHERRFHLGGAGHTKRIHDKDVETGQAFIAAAEAAAERRLLRGVAAGLIVVELGVLEPRLDEAAALLAAGDRPKADEVLSAVASRLHDLAVELGPLRESPLDVDTYTAAFQQLVDIAVRWRELMPAPSAPGSPVDRDVALAHAVLAGLMVSQMRIGLEPGLAHQLLSAAEEAGFPTSWPLLAELAGALPGWREQAQEELTHLAAAMAGMPATVPVADPDMPESVALAGDNPVTLAVAAVDAVKDQLPPSYRAGIDNALDALDSYAPGIEELDAVGAALPATADAPPLARVSLCAARCRLAWAKAAVELDRDVAGSLGSLSGRNVTTVRKAFELVRSEGVGVRVVRSTDPEGAGLLESGEELLVVRRDVLIAALVAGGATPEEAAQIMERFDALGWNDRERRVGVIGMADDRHAIWDAAGLLTDVVEHERLFHLRGTAVHRRVHAADVAMRQRRLARATGRPVAGPEGDPLIELRRLQDLRDIDELGETLAPLVGEALLVDLQSALDTAGVRAVTDPDRSVLDEQAYWWFGEVGQAALREQLLTDQLADQQDVPELAVLRAERDNVILLLRGAADGVLGRAADELSAAVRDSAAARAAAAAAQVAAAEQVVSRIDLLDPRREQAVLARLRAAAVRFTDLVAEAARRPVSGAEWADVQRAIVEPMNEVDRIRTEDPLAEVAFVIDTFDALKIAVDAAHDDPTAAGERERIREARAKVELAVAEVRDRFERVWARAPGEWWVERSGPVHRVLDLHERLEQLLVGGVDVGPARRRLVEVRKAYEHRRGVEVHGLAGLALMVLEARRALMTAEAAAAGPPADLVATTRAELAAAVAELAGDPDLDPALRNVVCECAERGVGDGPDGAGGGGASLFSGRPASPADLAVFATVVSWMPVAFELPAGDPALGELTGLNVWEMTSRRGRGLRVVDDLNEEIVRHGGPGDLAVWADADGWLYVDRRTYDALVGGVLGPAERRKLFEHEMEHIQHPDHAEVDVHDRAPLPDLRGLGAAVGRQVQNGSTPDRPDHPMRNRLARLGRGGWGLVLLVADGTAYVLTTRDIAGQAGTEVRVVLPQGEFRGTTLDRPASSELAAELRAAGAVAGVPAGVVFGLARGLDVAILRITDERLLGSPMPLPVFERAAVRVPVEVLPDPGGVGFVTGVHHVRVTLGGSQPVTRVGPGAALVGVRCECGADVLRGLLSGRAPEVVRRRDRSGRLLDGTVLSGFAGYAVDGLALLAFARASGIVERAAPAAGPVLGGGFLGAVAAVTSPGPDAAPSSSNPQADLQADLLAALEGMGLVIEPDSDDS
ncbi:hypothetical protein [Pseudonocardia sp. TRM90224]|uniref:hypothetical protein n=1 Tax=Pseudonocardia sp. TRM90224 TaxID=2812678 RepID=UPI001E5F15C0|nr:hypothetical protein [Pseudonocardia sp. TRM90224]